MVDEFFEDIEDAKILQILIYRQNCFKEIIENLSIFIIVSTSLIYFNIPKVDMLSINSIIK